MPENETLCSHVKTGPVEIVDNEQRKLLLNGIDFDLHPGTSMVLASTNGGFKISLTKDA